MSSKKVESQIREMDQRLKDLESLKKRLRETAKPDADDAQCGHIGDLVNSHPLLTAMLTAHLLKGGPEEGATITLWGKYEGLGGVFNVKPLGVKAFIDAGSLAEWLETAEHMLRDPDTKWARDRQPKRRRGPSGRQRR